VTHEPEFEVLVVERRPAAENVVELTLASASDVPLPDFEPGAHIDVELPGGLTRQYSLCTAPQPGHWRIAVLREPDGRGGSRYLHDSTAVGTSLRARGPRNHFPLVAAPDYLFIAGGIGITPLLAMIDRAERDGATWRLLYGGRTRSSMAYLTDLAERGAQVTICPQEEAGLLDLAAALEQTTPATQVYCCGPEPLLLAVEAAGAACSVPRDVHVERFAPKQTEPASADREFDVVFSRSGCTRRVRAGESIVTVAREAGIEVQTSCTEGVCGTCETAVLAGEVDHRDSVLTPEEQAENTVMLICVSRGLSDQLVLDR